jgi:arylsulfatase A
MDRAMKPSPAIPLLLLALLAPSPATAAAPARPNLLVFLTDDHGYGDLGCFGSRRVLTPHLDRLAADGARCTQFYAPASVCSPTRVGMLTGRSPLRLGIYTYIPNNSAMHLRRTERTLPALLREAGYDTCFVGKWAANGIMGSDRQPQPSDHGFDYYLASQNNAIPSHLDPTCFYRNGKPVPQTDGYSAALIVDEALQWLRQRPDPRKPFCLFVWFHEPHRVIATPPEFTAKHAHVRPDGTSVSPQPGQLDAPSLAEYLGNIAHVDHQVGRLLEHLAASGAADNTFTLFTSDNGPIEPGSAGPLRGGKGTLWEGGIRLPGIVRWPGHIPPGSIIDTPIGGLDLLPTFCAIAGIATPTDRALDGENIAPILEGRAARRTKPLFWWRAANEAALREGDWKIKAAAEPATRFPSRMAWFKGAALKKFELYNLREDPAEQRDLAPTQPEVLARLSAQVVGLYSEMQREAPDWGDAALPRTGDEAAAKKKRKK